MNDNKSIWVYIKPTVIKSDVKLYEHEALEQ